MADERDLDPPSPGLAGADVPPILRLTNARVTSQEVVADFDELSERLRASDAGPEARYAVPVEELLSVFTPERVRLVESLLEGPAADVDALARRVDRPPGEVADDLRALADGHVVHLRETAEGTRPVVPFEKVEIEIDVVPDAGEDGDGG